MCQAMDKDCLNCGKRGHFAAVCRSPAQVPGDKGSQRLSKRGQGPKRRNTDIHQVLAGVYTNQVSARPAPKVVVSATHPTGRDPVVWTPDSGAEATVMGLDVSMSLGIPQTALRPWNILVRARVGKQTHQDCRICRQGDERSLIKLVQLYCSGYTIN